MNRKTILIVFCSLMVLSALLSALRRDRDGNGSSTLVRVRDIVRNNSNANDNPARTFGNAVADAVEKVMPSVVVIRTEAIQYQIQRDFFGFAYRVPQRLAGQGSGVIVDEKGHILTSHHVVKGARNIEVVLNDGTKLPAEMMGCDVITDVAVLRIQGDGVEGLQPVEFGDSDAVRVGDVAIAIGSPYSLDSSVTVGHVSQKGRRVQILPYEDFIQTDAAINPGNSGGPLIDVEGRLIGINAAIHTTEMHKGNVGIAFAIPSNLTMVLAKSLIEKGYHEWPWVGASFGVIDPTTRRQFPGGAGVLVEQVWRDTPAAEAGLLPGDVILKVDGSEVKGSFDVHRKIFSRSVGDKVSFRVIRKEKPFNVELLLQAVPDRLL